VIRRPGTITTARPTYPTFAELSARRIEARRAAAIKALKEADSSARHAGGRLVAFGSPVKGGFHERSDLDVALCGLPPPTDSRVAVEVELALLDAGFTADLIPERFLPPGLAARLLAHGRVPSALD